MADAGSVKFLASSVAHNSLHNNYIDTIHICTISVISIFLLFHYFYYLSWYCIMNGHDLSNHVHHHVCLPEKTLSCMGVYFTVVGILYIHTTKLLVHFSFKVNGHA